MQNENVFAPLLFVRDRRPRARRHIDINASKKEVRLGNQQTGESLTLTQVEEINQDGGGRFLLRRSCLVGPLERSYFDKPRNNDKKCIKFNNDTRKL